MKSGVIKEVKVGYDKMITYVLHCGTTWISHKQDYSVGDTVRVIPFMGAVKVELILKGGQ